MTPAILIVAAASTGLLLFWVQYGFLRKLRSIRARK